MALTKRVYTDGETIITAQNLNDIQDEIISQGNTLVPKTRTVNSKALSTNITLVASDVGAAPTSHASSATTYGKGTSSNYGHVKLTDSLTDTTTAATGGLALSAKAGSDLKSEINGKQNTLTDISTTTEFTIQSSTYNLSCRRFGKVVNLNMFEGPKTLTAQSGWISVGTLPSDYRPSETLMINTVFNSTNVQIRLQSGGDISFAGIPAITDAYLVLNITYLV